MVPASRKPIFYGGKKTFKYGEAKELTCTTHGHELREWGDAGRRHGAEWRGTKGRKNGTNLIA